MVEMRNGRHVTFGKARLTGNHLDTDGVILLPQIHFAISIVVIMMIPFPP